MTEPSLNLSSLNNFWKECLNILQDTINPSAYNSWFSKIQFIDFKENELTLGVNNSFIQDYVKKHFKKDIETTASNIYKNTVKVVFLNLDISCIDKNISVELPKNKPDIKEKSLISTTIIDSILPLNTLYTFEKFIIGDSNQLAQVACSSVCSAPGSNNLNPLILCGKTGLGKTHLLQAMCFRIQENETSSKIAYRTSIDFLQEFLDYKNQDTSKGNNFHKNFKDIDVLLIDDIQFLADKTKTQEEFFKIFEMLKETGKQIVISCDKMVYEVKGLDHRLLSRFKDGIIIPLDPPTLETRLAILKNKLLTLPNTFIDNDVLDYVANSNISNIRELEGILVKLSAYANYMDISINLEIAKEILGDTFRNSNKPITIRSIIQFIAKQYNVTTQQITSLSRKKEVSLPRQIAMYFSSNMTMNSLHTIGLAFTRSHSTVIHSIEKINNLCESDVNFAKEIEYFSNKIQEPIIID